jgi:hypothetical protein
MYNEIMNILIIFLCLFGTIFLIFFIKGFIIGINRSRKNKNKINEWNEKYDKNN